MPAISINSATRTKTANLSNEESSVEVIKKYTYLDALRLEGKGLLEGDDKESIQEPPGFEKSANNRHAIMNGPAILKNQQLWGMEFTTCDITGETQPGSSPRDKELKPNPRRACSRPDQLRIGSKSHCSTGNSEDSIQKIAQEADDIGKALGVTVIQHERVAKRSMSQRLRKGTEGQQQTGKTKSKGKEKEGTKVC